MGCNTTLDVMLENKRVPFLNAYFDNIDFNELLVVLDDHIESRTPASTISLNADIVVKIESDTSFRRVFEMADLILMDSQPLIKVAKKQGIHVKEKLSGSDLLPRICNYASEKGYSCFILGGAEGVAERAATNLKSEYQNLKISGTYSPPFGFEEKSSEVEAVIEIVRKVKPDILFICLGTPKSEKTFYPYLNKLDVPFVFSVGAAVDFVAGNVKRAPVWMQKSGLEWLYRFVSEPKRLFRRYFVDSFQLLKIMRRS